MNKKLLFTSFASIALLGSIVAGGTYALFTSETSANISITSAQVSYTSTIDEDSITCTSREVVQSGHSFACGGTVTVSGSTLTIDKMVPGDKTTFNINITNNSNVKTKYKVSAAVSGELADALDLTIPTFTWTAREAGPNTTTETIVVSLPESVGNEYQNKAASIIFHVEAVQGNADVCDHLSTYTYTVEENKIYGVCDDCHRTFELSASQYNALEGKFLIKNGDTYTLATETMASYVNAVADGGCIDIYLIKGTYTLGGSRSTGTVYVNVHGLYDYDGNKASSIQCYTVDVDSKSKYISYSGMDLTVENLTLKGQDKESNNNFYLGIQPNKLTAKNCKVTGYQALYAGESYFTNCSFDSTTITKAKNDYSVYCYAGDATFKDCTFKSVGKAIKVYNEGSELRANIVVENCVFTSDASWAPAEQTISKKAAVEIDSTYVSSYTVTIKNSTQTGHSDIWHDSAAASKAHVTVS